MSRARASPAWGWQSPARRRPRSPPPARSAARRRRDGGQTDGRRRAGRRECRPPCQTRLRKSSAIAPSGRIRQRRPGRASVRACLPAAGGSRRSRDRMNRRWPQPPARPATGARATTPRAAETAGCAEWRRVDARARRRWRRHPRRSGSPAAGGSAARRSARALLPRRAACRRPSWPTPILPSRRRQRQRFRGESRSFPTRKHQTAPCRQDDRRTADQPAGVPRGRPPVRLHRLPPSTPSDSILSRDQPPFAAAGILATIRRLVVNSSSCSQGRSHATAL